MLTFLNYTGHIGTGNRYGIELVKEVHYEINIAVDDWYKIFREIIKSE